MKAKANSSRSESVTTPSPRHRTWRGQRGEARLVFIFWTAVLVFGGVAAFEWVPARMKVAEYEDYLVDAAQRAVRMSPKALKKDLMWKAGEIDLPLDPDNLQVQVSSGSARFIAEYTLELDFPFYTYDWNVKHDVKRRLFRF